MIYQVYLKSYCSVFFSFFQAQLPYQVEKKEEVGVSGGGVCCKIGGLTL